VRWGRGNAAAIHRAQSKVHARIDDVEGLARELGVRTNAAVGNAASSVRWGCTS
jgi:hypothetical protein